MKTSQNKVITNFLKYSVCAIAMCIAVISCNNREFRMGVDLVGGDKPETGDITFPVKAWSVPDFTLDTLSGRIIQGTIHQIDDPSVYIQRYGFAYVGNYSDSEIGDIRAGFATGLKPPAQAYFGDIIIDSVDLVISYTPVEDLSSGTKGLSGYGTNTIIYEGVFSPRKYVMYGNPGQIANLEIYRLGEKIPDKYHNVPGTNVEKPNHIPLNKTWKLAELIHKEEIVMNFDTIFSKTEIVDTTFKEDESGEITDTIFKYADSILPRMKLRLDKDYWQRNFIDHYKGTILTQENFDEYFKGLYFKIEDGIKSPLMMFDLFQSPNGNNTKCGIFIYYRSAVTSNGLMTIPFSNDQSEDLKAANSVVNILKQNIRSKIENPDTLRGEDKLYVLPFGGTEVVLDLITEENIKKIRDNGWLINDAYIEFSNIGVSNSQGSFPAIELWMYRYPYRAQFINYNSTMGYSPYKVDFYLPDEASYIKAADSTNYIFQPTFGYGLNGIINQNSTNKYDSPGKYRMRVTRTLIDIVHGTEKNVRLGVRLPMGVTQAVPNGSVLDGRNVKLIIKYSKPPREVPKKD